MPKKIEGRKKTQNIFLLSEEQIIYSYKVMPNKHTKNNEMQKKSIFF